MARVYVSIGSNIEPEKHVRGAVAALREAFGTVELSPVYESEAVGFFGDNFLNLVAAFDTDEDVYRVAGVLRAIEDRHGRERSGPRFSSRSVDLDLLLYDDLQLDEGNLKLPREEILHNAFVLLPLTDLIPDAVHPETGTTYRELWEAYDKGKQPLWVVDLPL